MDEQDLLAKTRAIIANIIRWDVPNGWRFSLAHGRPLIEFHLFNDRDMLVMEWNINPRAMRYPERLPCFLDLSTCFIYARSNWANTQPMADAMRTAWGEFLAGISEHTYQERNT